jgi:hypothetical protein
MSDYVAVLVDVREVNKLPPEFRPYVEIKANLEGRELTGSEKGAIFNISTTTSYVSIFLDEGKTIEQIAAELLKDAGAKMNHESAEAVKNALH